MTAKTRKCGWASIICGAVLYASGCSSLGLTPQSQVDLARSEASPGSSASQPACVVEFRTVSGRKSEKSVPITDELFVQDALEKSGAFKRFRRMNLELQRITPQGQPHLMIVSYDSSKRRAEPQCNYHLRAGDRLIVTEQSGTALDDMLDALGPLGKKKKTFTHTAIRG